MLIKSITSFCLFLGCLHVVAQAPMEKALLWKIESKSLRQPSYLYGTMHLMCPDMIQVTTPIQDKFKATKQLYLEIDLNDPQMMAKAMQGMQMKEGVTLKSLLPTDTYDSMNTVFKEKAGMPLSIMPTAKPLLLMSLLFPYILKCTPEGWEAKFQAMAKDQQMPMKGLETMEYQMRVFDTIPYTTQAEMLKSLLFNLDSTKKSINEMVALYQQKDIASLEAMTVKDPDFGRFEATMLINRNKNWIPVIAAAAKEMPTFFAVGAAHLAGTNGVINLLRLNGFTVTPVE